MAIMVCPRCGRQIDASAERCKYCGWRQDGPVDIAPLSTRSDAPTPETSVRLGPSVVVRPVVVRSGMSCWAVGLIVILTLLAMPVCAFLAIFGLAFMRGFLTGS
jgi:uncharacterized membrane protein YvbJ